ncbi:hypothetical protein EDC01DRAFT_161721 [Geopyxis carbonaria]|nr:hypothetical protein EDC01DRAFT_161721 [Geopyxis carbonaria]
MGWHRDRGRVPSTSLYRNSAYRNKVPSISTEKTARAQAEKSRLAAWRNLPVPSLSSSETALPRFEDRLQHHHLFFLALLQVCGGRSAQSVTDGVGVCFSCMKWLWPFGPGALSKVHCQRMKKIRTGLKGTMACQARLAKLISSGRKKYTRARQTSMHTARTDERPD